MSQILIILGVLTGVYILFQILTQRSRSDSATKDLFLPKTRSLETETKDLLLPETRSLKTETKTEPEERFFYLSEFEDLLNKYGLPQDKPEVFFELLNEVIKEGKTYARESLLKVIKDENLDLKSKAEEFLKVYKNLRQTPPVLKFELGKKNNNTPKIYISALESWAMQFGLEKELKENPKQTFIKIIKENLYQYGINSILNKIKVYTTHLEKEFTSDNLETLKNLMDMIERELNDTVLH